MPNVGVVCEGSHDFIFLEPIIERLLSKLPGDNEPVKVYALQPRIDATSMQIDGGGYEAVVQWLKANRGALLEKYLEQGLFETSNKYDLILIHLDGDVTAISAEFQLSQYVNHDGSIEGRIFALRNWAKELAQIPDNYIDKVYFAIPMLQTESWVLATLRRNSINLECRQLKNAAKRVLRRDCPGDSRGQVKHAGALARNKIQELCTRLISFKYFHDQF